MFIVMKKQWCILVGFLLAATWCWAQAPQEYVMGVKKTETEIRLDGVLDEAAWEESQLIGDFFQNYPNDTSYAKARTEVMVTFDKHFLYVGAIVYQDRSTYIVASLKRDFAFGSSDDFAVNLDPFQDKLNGFHFAVSPLNVQREGLIDNGGNINTDWDNKWYSQVSNHVDHWVVEMAIPFKTLRYKQTGESNSWRVNFVRRDIKRNEASSWVPVPRQFDTDNLAFTGQLVWETPPPSPGINVSLIPYVTGEVEKDFDFRLPVEYSASAGMDAKIAITPSLNLDLTFNPDFSQVEVDRQLLNLSRFELFFPERRQFFLENQDLFGMFGFPNSRPFFSRRVGLARGIETRINTEGEEVEVPRSLNVPILAGMRLSGKLNKNWRVGLLNMQTAEVSSIGLNPANYTVGVVQRRIFDRSTIGAVFVNKENFEEKPDGGYKLDQNGYNRIAGLEYNLFSKDGKWEAEAFYHRSISADNNDDAQAAALFIGHFTRNWRIFWGNQYIGSNYRADAGFVPRTGFLSIGPTVNYRFFPKRPGVAEKVVFSQVSVSSDFVFNRSDWRLVDRSHELQYYFEFQGQGGVGAEAALDYTYLFFPFDPTNSGGEELSEGTDYSYPSIRVFYDSDRRKNFFFGLGAEAGGYFNGERISFNGSLNYRWQPYGILALTFNHNNIDLPDPYSDADFWLIGPRAELSFSRSLFFSVFLQYNTQADNVNINSRLQWRFQPVSDLFLVYTDNYFSEDFFMNPRGKNRALVLKVTYWLNL
jgi:hypothetical protein